MRLSVQLLGRYIFYSALPCHWIQACFSFMNWNFSERRKDPIERAGMFLCHLYLLRLPNGASSDATAISLPTTMLSPPKLDEGVINESKALNNPRRPQEPSKQYPPQQE